MPQFFNNVAISGTANILGTATTPWGGTPGAQPGLSVTNWERQGPQGFRFGAFKYVKSGTGNFTATVLDTDTGAVVATSTVAAGAQTGYTAPVYLPHNYQVQVTGSTITGTSTWSAWVED